MFSQLATLLSPWGWMLGLFVFCFILGVFAILAGVGGGVLFVPLVGALFPIHIDYIRGAGLLVALCGGVAAAPRLIRQGYASLSLAIPLALFASAGSIVGALVGLSADRSALEILLGILILVTVGLFLVPKTAGNSLEEPVGLARYLRIEGMVEVQDGVLLPWGIRRLPLGLAAVVVIGFVGGLFGLGVGWANVPLLALLLGAPMKVAVATSVLIITINSSAAVWVYILQGGVIPVVAIPAILGMMLGTRLGSRFIRGASPGFLKAIVVLVLAFAGIRSIVSGVR